MCSNPCAGVFGCCVLPLAGCGCGGGGSKLLGLVPASRTRLGETPPLLSLSRSNCERISCALTLSEDWWLFHRRLLFLFSLPSEGVGVSLSSPSLSSVTEGQSTELRVLMLASVLEVVMLDITLELSSSRSDSRDWSLVGLAGVDSITGPAPPMVDPVSQLKVDSSSVFEDTKEWFETPP